jgi:hypothetical protein
MRQHINRPVQKHGNPGHVPLDPVEPLFGIHAQSLLRGPSRISGGSAPMSKYVVSFSSCRSGVRYSRTRIVPARPPSRVESGDTRCRVRVKWRASAHPAETLCAQSWPTPPYRNRRCPR